MSLAVVVSCATVCDVVSGEEGFGLSFAGRPTSPSRLPELVLIDAIDALGATFAARVGRQPVRVSHWDPSDHLMARLQRQELGLSFKEVRPYRYSYLLQRTPEVLRKLGFTDERAQCLIMENGTSCISAIANWLRLNQISEVALISPYYFAVPHNLRRLGIKVREVSAWCNGDFGLPVELDLHSRQALWLTNPIFSTGVYSLELHADRLLELANRGVVVICDEALAVGPSKIGAKLGGHPNFINISSPHKSICMNGVKFSAVVCHHDHLPLFEDWTDILSGGLSVAAVAAVDHFLTESFDSYQIDFNGLINEAKSWHTSVVSSLEAKIRIDSNTKGHFVTAYAPHLSAEAGVDLEFLSEILEATGCTVISGIRSGFDKRLGFCFRVNLAQDSPLFRSSLSSLYQFLASASESAIRERHQAHRAPLLSASAGLLNN